VVYRDGDAGQAQDPEQARRYLDLACRFEDQPACEELKKSEPVTP
jgi:hypothetical protein